MSLPVNERLQSLISTLKGEGSSLQESVNALSSGTKAPYTDIVDFQKAQMYGNERAHQLALMQSLQTSSALTQTSVAYLEDLTGKLREMGALAKKSTDASSNQMMRQLYDKDFQELKKQISLVVDGMSGQHPPAGSFGERPLFLGDRVMTDLDASSSSSSRQDSVNLYTGYATPGFNQLPLRANNEEGKALTVEGSVKNEISSNQLQLDENAFSLNEVYEGAEITLSQDDPAIEQTARIVSYDGVEKVATLSAPLNPLFSQQLHYKITAPLTNQYAYQTGEQTSVTGASFIWGGDNYRLGTFNSEDQPFIPLTDAERNYRTAQGISDTDATPYTLDEQQARREHNIFDPVYGSIQDSAQAKTMMVQISHAVEQLSTLMSRYNSQTRFLEMRYDLLQDNATQNGQGVELFSSTDVSQESVNVAKQSNQLATMYQIAKLVNENHAKLISIIK